MTFIHLKAVSSGLPQGSIIALDCSTGELSRTTGLGTKKKKSFSTNHTGFHSASLSLPSSKLLLSFQAHSCLSYSKNRDKQTQNLAWLDISPDHSNVSKEVPRHSRLSFLTPPSCFSSLHWGWGSPVWPTPLTLESCPESHVQQTLCSLDLPGHSAALTMTALPSPECPDPLGSVHLTPSSPRASAMVPPCKPLPLPTLGISQGSQLCPLISPL